jgi:hypothetical protein
MIRIEYFLYFCALCFLNKRIMSVKYIVVPHGNPDAPKKFYARAKGEWALMSRKLRMEINEKSPAVIGKSLAVFGKSPAVVGKSLAVFGKSPAIIGKFPAVIDKSPAVIGKFPAIIGKSLAVIGKFPAVVVWFSAVIGRCSIAIGEFLAVIGRCLIAVGMFSVAIGRRPIAGKQSDKYTPNDILVRYIQEYKLIKEELI